MRACQESVHGEGVIVCVPMRAIGECGLKNKTVNDIVFQSLTGINLCMFCFVAWMVVGCQEGR